MSNVNALKRKSGSFKRQSLNRSSIISASKREKVSLQNPSYRDDSVSAIVPTTSSKINYQEELILIFFDSMLYKIVDEWFVIPDDVPVCLCKDKPKEERKESSAKDVQTDAQDDLNNSSATSVPKKRKHRRSSHSGSYKKNSLDKNDGTIYRKKSKLMEKGDDNRSKISVNKIDIQNIKSYTSSSTVMSPTSSDHSIDWLLNPPKQNVIIKFKNGNRYEGLVEKRTMHGHGKFFWADGAVYEGEFVQGNATGNGTLLYPDLVSYTGEFCKSFLHGEGVLNVSSSTMIYKGGWKGGQKHGKGWLLYQPESWYDGEWYEGKRQGVGFMQYKIGERYKGGWYQGKMDGEGTMAWNNDDIYEGSWKDGVMDGYGEYTWNAFLNESLTFPLENNYRGSWINGMRDGVGIMSFGVQGGAKLIGMWNENKKHGPGIVVCGNGTMIKRNPLFWNDKPIHLDNSSNGDLDDEDLYALQSITKQLKENNRLSDCNCDIKDCIPELGFVKLNKEIDLIKGYKSCSDFSPMQIASSPIYIPIQLPQESIDLSYFINLAVEKYTSILYKNEAVSKDKSTLYLDGSKSCEGRSSILLKYSKWNIMTHSEDLSNSKISQNDTPQRESVIKSRLATYQQLQSQIEEKYLRNAIAANLPHLHEIYIKYASIALHNIPNYEPILIRLYLWQMLRDLNIMDSMTSLIDIDSVFLKNPAVGFETNHNPFEKVYFWQYLQLLLSLSWELHSPEDVTIECKRFGILSIIFTKFLNETFYINVIAITPICPSIEYKDLVPINNIYQLYLSVGEPHSARRLLNRMCPKKGRTPPSYLHAPPNEKKTKLIKGVNVASFSGNIAFLPDNPPDIGQKPDEQELEQLDDPFRRQLYVFRSLGPKRIVQCFTTVCPQIAEDDVIVNIEYPLSFIEFHEIILKCTQMLVDRAKKRNERIKEREERKAMALKAIHEEPLLKNAKNMKELKKSKHK